MKEIILWARPHDDLRVLVSELESWNVLLLHAAYFVWSKHITKTQAESKMKNINFNRNEKLISFIIAIHFKQKALAYRIRRRGSSPRWKRGRQRSRTLLSFRRPEIQAQFQNRFFRDRFRQWESGSNTPEGSISILINSVHQVSLKYR